MSDTTASSPRRLVIATRESRLALWQAEHVKARLEALYPDCTVELLGMTTRGDRILDRTLSKVGGKGLFIKELETALLDGRADLAVHSLKDVPVDLEAEFSLAAVMTREDPRDAFVSPQYATLADMPPGARVGTSSLRRESQIRARYPQLQVLPLRGNLDTRLGKLDRGEYDAIVLAAAGLTRLGLGDRIRALLAVEDSLPAAGQGALGIEVRADRADLHAWLAPLSDAASLACATAERAVSRALGGSCQVPLAAYAEHDADGASLYLRALVARPDGKTVMRSEQRGPAADADRLGRLAAQSLLDEGADRLLATVAQVVADDSVQSR
ncbi:hydroxymethylbilane synthase [Achromobacter sp. GG226]|uniref:hydroxymethylbilane synthase n=1 Tax=Verticiella alkaliphila TaxID=2779529 RepID=UPI001C0B2A07|nr:hydroxymethylbilane synthase [Verticiella sp. GG226]MBU4609886.1 hydroxymethylbilane synthase [Verticiella sp. GG226]